MIVSTPVLLDSFHCTSSECRDCCCSARDFTLDRATFYEYQKMMGKGDAFARKLAASVKERGGEPFFKRRENGDCPFLTGQKLCELRGRLGESRLCESCREYPAYHRDIGQRREIWISFACPEILRLVLTRPAPFAFRERTVDTIAADYEGVDREFLPHLFTVRDRMLSIAQNRNFSVTRRATILLRFAAEVQTLIRARKYNEITAAAAPYSSDSFLGTETDAKWGNPVALEQLMRKLFETELKIDFYLESDRNEVETVLHRFHDKDLRYKYGARLSEFRLQIGARHYEYEKWLVNLLYRYVTDAAYDRDLLTRVKFAVASVLSVFELGAAIFEETGTFSITDQEKLLRRCAHELEYYDGRHPRLIRFFSRDRAASTAAFLSALD